MKQEVVTGIRLVWLAILFMIAVLSLVLLETKLALLITLVLLGIEGGLFILFTNRKELLSPGAVIPVFYTMYAVGPVVNNDVPYAPFEDSATLFYLFLMILGMLALRKGISFGVARGEARVRKQNEQGRIITRKDLDLLKLAGVLLLGLALFGVATQVVAFGGLGGLIRFGYRPEQYLVIDDSFIFGVGYIWWLLAGVVIGYHGLLTKSVLRMGFGLLLYAWMTYVLLRIGGRNHLVHTMFFAVVLLHYGYRRFPTRLIVGGLLAGLTFFNIYARGRWLLAEGFAAMAVQQWESIRLDPTQLFPWSASEFSTPAVGLLEILEFGGPPLVLGRSYISAIGMPLPYVARLTSAVGFNVSDWVMQAYHLDMFLAGGGNGFSPVTEGYMNFGVVGVALHMGIYGMAVGWVYGRMRARPTLGRLLLFAGVMPVFSVMGLRIYAESMTYNLFRGYLAPWILFMLLMVLFAIPLPKRRLRRAAASLMQQPS